MTAWSPPVVEWDEVEELEQLIEDDKAMRAQMAAFTLIPQPHSERHTTKALAACIPCAVERNEFDELKQLMKQDKKIQAQKAVVDPVLEYTASTPIRCSAHYTDLIDTMDDADNIEDQDIQIQSVASTPPYQSSNTLQAAQPIYYNLGIQERPFSPHDPDDLDCLGRNRKFCRRAMIGESTKNIGHAANIRNEVVSATNCAAPNLLSHPMNGEIRQPPLLKEPDSDVYDQVRRYAILHCASGHVHCATPEGTGQMPEKATAQKLKPQLFKPGESGVGKRYYYMPGSKGLRYPDAEVIQWVANKSYIIDKKSISGGIYKPLGTRFSWVEKLHGLSGTFSRGTLKGQPILDDGKGIHYPTPSRLRRMVSVDDFETVDTPTNAETTTSVIAPLSNGIKDLDKTMNTGKLAPITTNIPQTGGEAPFSIFETNPASISKQHGAWEKAIYMPLSPAFDQQSDELRGPELEIHHSTDWVGIHAEDKGLHRGSNASHTTTPQQSATAGSTLEWSSYEEEVEERSRNTVTAVDTLAQVEFEDLSEVVLSTKPQRDSSHTSAPTLTTTSRNEKHLLAYEIGSTWPPVQDSKRTILKELLPRIASPESPLYLASNGNPRFPNSEVSTWPTSLPSSLPPTPPPSPPSLLSEPSSDSRDLSTSKGTSLLLSIVPAQVWQIRVQMSNFFTWATKITALRS
jgi:hypothetical protein